MVAGWSLRCGLVSAGGVGWSLAGTACGRVPASREYSALAFWLRAEYVSLFLDRGAKGPGVWSPIAACVRGARGWLGLGRALGVSLGTDVRTTLRCSKPAPYVLLFSKAGCDTGGCGKHSVTKRGLVPNFTLATGVYQCAWLAGKIQAQNI